MRAPQLILIIVAIVTIALIYVFGNTKVPVTDKAPMASSHQQSGAANMSSDDAEQYILSKAGEHISKTLRDSINNMIVDAQKTNGSAKADLFYRIAKMWARSGNTIAGGIYLIRAAESDAQATRWKTAAEVLKDAFAGAADSVAKNFAVEQSIRCFDEVLKLNPKDNESKIDKAICLVEGKGQPMQGVLLLKEVEKEEPDNEVLNITLGKLAIVSGQYDKAISRFERMTALYPDNLEAWYQLAQAYRAVGRKNDAVKMLEICKSKSTNSPEAIKEINQLINEIKNN